MTIATSCARALSAAVLLLAATTTAGCGSADDDDPAVCSSVDSLESSVAGLTDITIDPGALADLESSLDEVKSDLSKVKDDASEEFAAEVDAVEQATSGLGTRLDAAVATPSLETVSAVGTAVQTLGTSLKSLADAVKSTC